MEDKDILHAVIEADRAAREALNEAKQRQKLLSRGEEEIYAAAEKKAMAAAEAELEKRRSAASREAEKSLRELAARHSEDMERLAGQYELVKDECIERIFSSAVGLS